MSLPVLHDEDPNEGCESVTLGVTAVTGQGSAVLDGGIHDVSAEASVRIEETTFTSAVLETAPPEGLDAAGGGLSPATAQVGISRDLEPQVYGVLCTVCGASDVVDNRWVSGRVVRPERMNQWRGDQGGPTVMKRIAKAANV